MQQLSLRVILNLVGSSVYICTHREYGHVPLGTAVPGYPVRRTATVPTAVGTATVPRYLGTRVVKFSYLSERYGRTTSSTAVQSPLSLTERDR